MGDSRLVWLDIEGLRNIRRARLEIDAPLVWLYGRNGAGKSSVLEAIYLLARGGTYRGRKFGPLMNRDMTRTQIRGGVATASSDTPIEIHYRQNEDGTERIVLPPGAFATDRGESWISIKLVTDNPQGLIEGDPQLRRLFLDWNGLRWNKRYREVRQKFQRVLLQRNAALKVGGRYQDHWDRAFVETGGEIDMFRADFISALRSEFEFLKAGFAFLNDVELAYDRGWQKNLGLGEVLETVGSQEKARGFSVAGPHRADLLLLRDGRRAAFSRGQMKIVVCLLQLGCERMHLGKGLGRAIWLLDDMESDLDEENACSIWTLFVGTGSQLIATGVSPGSKSMDASRKFAMFHVEHGTVSRRD